MAIQGSGQLQPPSGPNRLNSIVAPGLASCSAALARATVKLRAIAAAVANSVGSNNGNRRPGLDQLSTGAYTGGAMVNSGRDFVWSLDNSGCDHPKRRRRKRGPEPLRHKEPLLKQSSLESDSAYELSPDWTQLVRDGIHRRGKAHVNHTGEPHWLTTKGRDLSGTKDRGAN